MAKARSVILLSGGLDSAANLALCAERDEPVLALTVDYGQRAARRELAAAQMLCTYYRVAHRSVDIRWLGALGGSSLTDPGQGMPSLARADLDDMDKARETAKAVWVPNRNGMLINLAASYAERQGAIRVVVGFNREEAATFPDNSAEYLARATAALALSTANQVTVHSYTVAADKREIVRELRALARPFPFELVWSCYEGGERPCGRCESCNRLARALGEKSS